MSASSENLIYNSKHYGRLGFVRGKETIPDISIKLIQTVYTDVEIVRGKKKKRNEGRWEGKRKGDTEATKMKAAIISRAGETRKMLELQEHRGGHLVAAYTLRKV